MKITIVPDDNTIIENGVVTIFDFSELVDSNIHAVQWDGNKGFIEYKEYTPDRKAPKKITNLNLFQPIIDASAEARIAQATAIEQAEIDRLNAMTYKDKRYYEYPDVRDQLDTLWKLAESNGLTADENAEDDTAPKMLANIKTVKTKYPKV